MNLHQLFPIPVAFFSLGRELTDQELSCILSQNKRSNMGNSSSENNYLLNQPQLQNLSQIFTDWANQFFIEIYRPKRKVKLRVTQSWANYTEPGQFHHKHAHPNSVVSGVFYVQTQQNQDRIYFYKSVYQQLKFPAESYNVYNSESWWFNAVQSELIMFPSGLEHQVETLPLDAKTRISISFNTFCQGEIGDELELTELML